MNGGYCVEGLGVLVHVYDLKINLCIYSVAFLFGLGCCSILEWEAS